LVAAVSHNDATAAIGETFDLDRPVSDLEGDCTSARRPRRIDLVQRSRRQLMDVALACRGSRGWASVPTLHPWHDPEAMPAVRRHHVERAGVERGPPCSTTRRLPSGDHAGSRNSPRRTSAGGSAPKRNVDAAPTPERETASVRRPGKPVTVQFAVEHLAEPGPIRAHDIDAASATRRHERN
jgi:hypothetical protein